MFRQALKAKSIALALAMSMLFTLLPSLSATAADPGPYTISGAVKNAVTDEPLTTFEIILNGASLNRQVQPAADGTYSFSNVPNGEYNIWIYQSGLRDGSVPVFETGDKEQTITINGSNASHDFLLQPYATGNESLTIQVLGAPEGSRSAWVNFWCSGSSQSRLSLQASANSNTGLLTFYNLPSSSCGIYAQLHQGNYLPMRVGGLLLAELPDGYVQTLNFQAEAANVIRGRVTSSVDSGQGISGVRVSAMISPGANGQAYVEWYGYATTDSSGNYEITDVPLGNIRVSAHQIDEEPQYFSASQTPVTITGALTEFDISLQPYPVGTDSIVGTIEDSDGNPIANANVNFQLIGSNPYYSVSTTTDADGRFIKQDLPAGRYWVGTYSSDYITRYKYTLLTAGQTTSLYFLVKNYGTGSVSGVVRNSANNQVQGGLTVLASYSDGTNDWSETRITDSSGRYNFPKVPDGNISLSVQAQEGSNLLQGDPIDIEVAGTDEVQNLTVSPYPTGNKKFFGVINGSGNIALQNVLVRLRCQTNQGLLLDFSTSTNQYGLYEVPNLPEATCGISATKSGFMNFNLGGSYDEDGPSLETLANSASIGHNFQMLPMGTATISGYVRDTNGNAIPGAQVYANFQSGGSSWSASKTTDSSGYYEMQEVPTSNLSGTFRLSTYIYSDQTQYFDLQPIRTAPSTTNQEFNFDFEPIPPGPLTVEGWLTNRQDNSPVAGSMVSVSSNLNRPNGEYQSVSGSATSDEDGFYSITGLYPGNLDFNINSENTDAPYDYAYANVTTSANEILKEKNFALIPVPTGTGSITGKIFDEEGNPLSRVSVRLNLEGINNFYRNATTRSNGVFEFENLPKGTFTINANSSARLNGRAVFKSPDYDSRRFELGTSATNLPDANIVMTRYQVGSGEVHGRLFDRTLNQPRVNATVSINSFAMDFPGQNISTGLDGTWSARNLPDGSYHLDFSFSGDGSIRYPESRFFTINNGEVLNLPQDNADSLLGGNETLILAIKDKKTHKPIAGVDVNLWLQNSNVSVQGQTDIKGRATFSNMETGSYYVGLTKEGYAAPMQQSTVLVQEGRNNATLSMEFLNAIGTVSGIVTDEWDNPIAGASIYTSFNTYSTGPGSGDGYGGPTATTNDSGEYTLNAVPTRKKITLYVQGPEESGFAPISDFVTLNAAPFTRANKDFVLTVGSSIVGSVASSTGEVLKDIQVTAFDSVSGEYVASTEVDQFGDYTLSGLPVSSVKLFLTDNRWRSPYPKMTFGYLKRTAALTSIVKTAKSDAETFSIQSGATYSIGETMMQTGGTISGIVKLQLGDELSVGYSKYIQVNLLRWTGSAWYDYSSEISYETSGWEGGRFKADGLPDGTYRLKFSEPWASAVPLGTVYAGENGAVASEASAKSFVVTSGDELTTSDIIMSVPEPVGAPATIASELLTTEMKDQVQAPSRVDPSAAVPVKVGEEHVGEWVGVSVQGTVSSSSASIRSGSMRIASIGDVLVSRAAVSSTPEPTESWVQVQADGNVWVPGLESTGELTIVVQDAANELMGWATVSIATAPVSESPGGGGGGGSAISLPTIPNATKAPTLTGTFLKDQVIVVDNGEWAADWPLQYSYRWFRCDSPVTAKAGKMTAKGCLEIESEIGQWHMLNDLDLKKHIAVEVTATDEVNTGVHVTASISGIPTKVIKLTKKPKITGTYKVGRTLSVTKPTWSSSLKPKSVKYQWYRCSTAVAATYVLPQTCKSISKATKTSYKLSKNDKGKFVTVRIVGANGSQKLTYLPAVKSKAN